jgi:hypothetical protein
MNRAYFGDAINRVFTPGWRCDETLDESHLLRRRDESRLYGGSGRADRFGDVELVRAFLLGRFVPICWRDLFC